MTNLQPKNENAGILIEPEGPAGFDASSESMANPRPMHVIAPGHYANCYVCGLDMARLDPSAKILRSYERNGKVVYVISYCYWCWHGTVLKSPIKEGLLRC